MCGHNYTGLVLYIYFILQELVDGVLGRLAGVLNLVVEDDGQIPEEEHTEIGF